MASVPVDERTKARLQELCEEIEAETGREVSESTVVERVLEHGFESREELIASFRDEFEGISEEAKEQWLSGTAASGNPVEEDEIDRVLYGDEAGPE